MQQKIVIRYASIAISLCVFGFLLANHDWRPATQDSHEQPTKPVSTNIEPISYRRSQPTVEHNLVRPPIRIQAKPLVPKRLSDKSKFITGRVLDLQGKELADIQISILPRKIFNHKGRRNETELRQNTRSNAFGQYTFDGLVPGEYQIQTEETAEYTSNRIDVYAGNDHADLVLSAKQEIWVYGQVVDHWGTPLRGVRVDFNGQVSDSVYTDHNGGYEIYATRTGHVRHPDRVRFSLPGYSTRKIRLPPVDLTAEELKLQNVVLSHAYTPGFVRGLVYAGNLPLADARVYLRSMDSKLYYQSVTDDYGSFEFKDLATGKYTVRVVAGTQYQDYQESGLRVDALGLDLSIELKTLKFGPLTGQMVDPGGTPVPRFTLWMTSDSGHALGPRAVTGDQHGFFSINHVPYGDQNFRTHSIPRFRITGIRHFPPPHASKPAQLILDWGTHIIASQVTDTTGRPLAGTVISLTWEQRKGGITYHSERNTIADRKGHFRFSQLSAGVHTLRLSAPGNKHRHRLDFDVGSKALPVVRLPTRPK